MKENTRRELLERLKLIAAASAVGYVAPTAMLIDTAWADPDPPCSQPPCKKKKKKKKKRRRRRRRP
jgi:hypothetical protein